MKRKLTIYCYSVESSHSKNVYGNPRLQRPNINKKYTTLRNFSVKCGRCNLEFPSTFLESTGITQYCPALDFLLTLFDIKTHRGARGCANSSARACGTDNPRARRQRRQTGRSPREPSRRADADPGGVGDTIERINQLHHGVFMLHSARFNGMPP